MHPASHLAQTRFGDNYLTRPLFLDSRELGQLEQDLALLGSALGDLPRRLFGGDLAAFARAVGATDFQTECALRSRAVPPRPVTTMARADLYRDAAGFRVLEWNLGSPISGVEVVELCDSLRHEPDMASFIDEEQLTYPDTVEAMLATVRAETGFPTGSSPVMALLDTPQAMPRLEALLKEQAAHWAGSGLRTVVGHLGELTRSDGRLLLRGEPLDVIFRLFTMDDALTNAHSGLFDDFLTAAERGEVVVFTPMDAELFGSKGALALLSQLAAVQGGLTEDEHSACGRLVPWTRQVRPGPTTLEDGEQVDLADHVLAHQGELVLKPSMSYGGKGVLVGADPETTPEVWRAALGRAMDAGSYVVQKRVYPVAEWFPADKPEDAGDWTVTWGVFMMQKTYAGSLIRAVPSQTGQTVVNVARGALLGCALNRRGTASG